VAEAADNIAGAVHNRRALRAAGLTEAEVRKAEAAAKTAARDLIRGWDWGKWT